MSELQIIVSHAVVLRAPLQPGCTREIAKVLHRQLPVLADMYGAAAAVVEQDGVAHLIASVRR